jgi:hypothetical protein
MKTITLKMLKTMEESVFMRVSQIKIDQVLGFYLGTNRVPVFTWASIGTRSDPI